MIRIKRVRRVPDEVVAELSGYSKMEYEAIGADKMEWLYMGTRGIYVLYDSDTPLFVGGIVQEDLINGAELWFMTCNAIGRARIRVLRMIMKIVRRLLRCFLRLKISIAEDFQRGHYLTRWLGFRPVGEAEHFGYKFTTYERRLLWL